MEAGYLFTFYRTNVTPKPENQHNALKESHLNAFPNKQGCSFTDISESGRTIRETVRDLGRLKNAAF